MAITGTLTADFASFFDACAKAQVSLKGFEASTGKVESSLNRMVDNFSGRKIISEATLMAEAVERVGGTSHLTAAELQRVGSVAAEAAEKLKAWGQDVPKNIQDLATHAKTATANFESMGSVVTKLASAFGITFSIAAVVNFGRELFAAADALTRLSDKTGLSVEGLQRFQIAGDDAGNTIEEIAAAITKMQDKLVGGDSSAAGALAKLGLGFAALKGLSPEEQFIAISDAIRQIEDPALRVNIAIDLFGKAGANVLPTLKRGFDDLKGAAVGMSAETVKTLDSLGDELAKSAREFKGFAASALAWWVSISDPDRRVKELESSIKSLGAEAEKTRTGFGALVPPGLPADLAKIEAGFDADAKAITVASAALEKWQAAMVELNAVGVTWQDTLDGIDGAVVEAVQHYLAAGVSQTALATAYALSAAQIKAIASALADKLAASKSMMEFEDAAARREFEIRNLQTKATNDAILETLKERQAAEAASDAFVTSALRAAQAQDALNNSVKSVTGSYWAQVDAAAAASGVTVVGHRADEGGGINMGGAPNLSKSSFSLGGFSLGPTMNVPSVLSSHASGGPVSAGLAMLHDNEYVVPEGGALVLRGGGGVTVHNVFNIVDTADNLSRKVADLVMKTVKQGTKLAGSA